MKPQALLALAAVAISATPAFSDDLQKRAQSLFQPIPIETPVLNDNPGTPAKIELGAMLYFDPRLSESHTIACNSCHQIGLGGTDGMGTSLGHRWQKGGRNAPTVLNAVFNVAQFWDGRAKDLEAQAGGPMANPIEMATTHPHVIEMLKKIPGYKTKFEAAFPGDNAPIIIGNVTKAIAVFEATLTTPNAPFDKYLKGEEKALDADQKAGLRLFIDKGCAGCHDGVNIGGARYAQFGVVEKPNAEILPPGDKGRANVTSVKDDEYVFRVPSLRNVELTPPYFHTGKVWGLEQSVAIMGQTQVGAKLNNEEVKLITAFLKSLTGDQPKVVYPTLPPSTEGTPTPQP